MHQARQTSILARDGVEQVGHRADVVTLIGVPAVPGAHVGGAVEDHIDTAHRLAHSGGNAKIRRDELAALAHGGRQGLPVLHQEPDSPALLQQALRQMPADESGRARHQGLALGYHARAWKPKSLTASAMSRRSAGTPSLMDAP